MIANFTGYRRDFVEKVRNARQRESLKAMRAYVQGHDYEPTIVESFKNLGRAVKRAVEKRTLRNWVAGLPNKLGFRRRGMA